jgi:hypothetical protein
MRKFGLITASLLLAGQASAATMTLVERAIDDKTTVHASSGDDNVGDILTFHNPLFDAGNSSKVGYDQGYCVRLEVGKSYECHWTMVLANGQLVVDGPFLDAGDSDLAITGGTGAYATARGQLHLHARDAKGSAYDFGIDVK